MKKLAAILLTTCLGALTAGENMVKNGSLEKGKGHQPSHWAKLDGITAKWDKDGGNPGGHIHIDTSVLQKDKKAYAEHPDAYKVPGKGGQYDTVGAHEGAWAYAEPIDVKKDDRWFILSCDVKSKFKSTELAAPMVFVRGFQKVTETKAGQDSSWFHEYYGDGVAYSEMFGPDKLYRPSRAGDYLMCYRHTLVCRLDGSNEWQHFELGFQLPSMPQFRPQRLLLKLYAFWPNGHYHFDNLSLRRATKQEATAANSRRPSIRENM